MYLHLTFTIFLLPSTILSHPTDAFHVPHIPNVHEAAAQARTLVRSEGIGTISTIFPANDPHGLSGQPIGMMDYFADCSENGDPTFLAVKIATSFKNARNNASISLAIRHHSPDNEFRSPVAHHRVSLLGRLTPPIPHDTHEGVRLHDCFIARHPDARLWVPGRGVHDSEWVQMEVEKVYWVGGFGDREFIGFLPVDIYRNATPAESVEVGKGEAGGGVAVMAQGVWQRVKGLLQVGGSGWFALPNLV